VCIQARYRCKSGFSSFVEQKESLQCVFPFIHAWEFYTTYYSPISSDELRQNEVVLLCFDLSLTCQTTLELLDIDLVMVCVTIIFFYYCCYCSKNYENVSSDVLLIVKSTECYKGFSACRFESGLIDRFEHNSN